MRQLSLLLLLSSTLMAATHYVTPAGSGSKTGADWNNACSGFAGGSGNACAQTSMVRGDTYYVAGGTYAAATFHTSESGTIVITVKGATATDHGTDTGWSNSLGVDVTPGTFTAPGISVWNGYYVIDGNTGSPLTGSSSYGFTVALPSSCSSGNNPIEIGEGGSTVNNVQISHFYLIACSGDVATTGIYLQTTTIANNHIYSYNYFNGFEAAIFDHSTGVTIDHNYSVNGYSSPSHHGNQFDFVDESPTYGSEVNPTISNNQILNCAGTVCIGANDTGSTCNTGMTGGAIYGNIFNATLTNGGSEPVGDGIIGATTRCFIQNTLVYQNVFTGSSTGWFQGCVTGATTCSSATGNSAENNIIWNDTCSPGSGVGSDDYNSYFACLDKAPVETHGQVVAGLNPFVDTSSNNFALASDGVSSCTSTTAVCTGISLGSPYNIDPLGNVRGSDGTWERGAYEYVLNGQPAPPAKLASQVNP